MKYKFGKVGGILGSRVLENGDLASEYIGQRKVDQKSEYQIKNLVIQKTLGNFFKC